MVPSPLPEAGSTEAPSEASAVQSTLPVTLIVAVVAEAATLIWEGVTSKRLPSCSTTEVDIMLTYLSEPVMPVKKPVAVIGFLSSAFSASASSGYWMEPWRLEPSTFTLK